MGDNCDTCPACGVEIKSKDAVALVHGELMHAMCAPPDPPDGADEAQEKSALDDLGDELADFIEHHRAHGTVTADATEPMELGYLVTLACPCGVVFYRWVTVDEAAREMICSTILAMPEFSGDPLLPVRPALREDVYFL